MNPRLLANALAMLLPTLLLATLFASLRHTGNAGIARLIERDAKTDKRLAFWKTRWDLLAKTIRLLFVNVTGAGFVLLFLALRDLSAPRIAAGIFLYSILQLLAGRVFPRILSEAYADRISLALLPLASATTLLLYPIVRPVQRLEDRLLRHFLARSGDADRPSPEDEIKTLIEETDHDDLEEEERDIIRSVFEFGDTVVREIMTPRVDVAGLKDSLSVSECIERAKPSPHSRFPVFHENVDEIVGIIHVKDLLRHGPDPDTPVARLAKKVDFVPETMPINDLMQLMKKNHAQMVLVVDEYGGTEGLVTMEDVIEELVGEIEDEYDATEKQLLHRQPDGSWLAQARIPVFDLNEALPIRLPESDEYDSLGGYVVSRLGRIPLPGETLELPDYRLRVQAATPRRIQAIRILPREQPRPPERTERKR